MKEITDPKLLEVYSSWADELLSRYQRISNLFKHGPSIGRSREAYLADVLRRCLPTPLEVCHGAFYTPGQGASREQDLMIVDKSKCAPVEEINGFGVYLKESVRACIEVKSKLTKKELIKGVRSVVEAKKFGPGADTRYVLFAYDSPLSAKALLENIENSEDFIDFRPDLIIVLGKFVVVMRNLKPKKPRPRFDLKVFCPKPNLLDLTLVELIDTIMELKGHRPFSNLKDEIISHFKPVASRTFVCPVERPGTGLGTNLDFSIVREE